MSYKTFIRSYCPAHKEPHGLSNNFLRGRRITQDTGLSYTEAQDRCEAYNKNRNARQIRKGTMMEFTEE
jgi:hypothetical protein